MTRMELAAWHLFRLIPADLVRLRTYARRDPESYSAERLDRIRQRARNALPDQKGDDMTSLHQKAEHVRAAIASGKTGRHTCHWPGCQKSVAPAAWGCRPHWYALPQALRNKIWASYVPKQEETKTPSRRYVEVAREVQQWIKENSK